MPCMCFTQDDAHQGIGCILLHFQCGLCPFGCCHYDDNGLCWGCVCCKVQIDPCWLNRQVLHLLCLCVPCGCIAEETLHIVCCCNKEKATGEASGY
eukprot:gene15809-17772_t